MTASLLTTKCYNENSSDKVTQQEVGQQKIRMNPNICNLLKYLYSEVCNNKTGSKQWSKRFNAATQLSQLTYNEISQEKLPFIKTQLDIIKKNKPSWFERSFITKILDFLSLGLIPIIRNLFFAPDNTMFYLHEIEKNLESYSSLDMKKVTSQPSVEEKEPCTKEIIRDKIWGLYPQAQMTGDAPDQTRRFFSSLHARNTTSFFTSTNRIIQFGVASGKFLQNDSLIGRERIGYDYTQASASIVPFKHRLIDLNEFENEKLTYQSCLDEDLSVPCDILLIRLLEYLDAKTVTLLLSSLIATAKPGSVFYIEFNEHQNPSPLTNNISIGEIRKFFKPEENFKIDLHSVRPENGDADRYGDTEQLIVTKCK